MATLVPSLLLQGAYLKLNVLSTTAPYLTRQPRPLTAPSEPYTADLHAITDLEGGCQKAQRISDRFPTSTMEKAVR